MTRNPGDFFIPIWDDFDGELFQELVVDLLKAEGFEVEYSGVGPDGGIDVFADQKIRFGYNNPEPFVWAVQCKFISNPNKSISPSAVGEILNVVSDERFKEKKISGYFLVTNCRFSTNMMSQLRGLNNKLPGFKTTYWDRSRVHDLLNEHPKVYSKYFWPLIEKRSIESKIGFTANPSKLLEEMLHNPNATEADLFAFFNENPHLLLKALGSGIEVFSQVTLKDEERFNMIPDFLIKPTGSDPWTIVELRRPQSKLLVGGRRPIRFSSDAIIAVGQLREYQHFFELPSNREKLEKRIGFEIFRPRLVLLIGTDYGSSPQNAIINLKSYYQDVDFFTYSEIVERIRD